MELFNYSHQTLQEKVIDKKGWGSYLIADNFLGNSLFNLLTSDLNDMKKAKKDIFSGEENVRAWDKNMPKGKHHIIGGAGSDINKFNKLFSHSEIWKNFTTVMMNDQNCYKYFHRIFQKSEAYNSYVSKSDILDGYASCKLSCQYNNYADIIHPDNTRKVLSFLIYLDNKDWNENSKGGTDFWSVEDEDVAYDKSEDSLASQMRIGKNSDRPHSISTAECEKIKKFQSIAFKPNRLVAFVKTDTSYHSIPPRILPAGISRDCFQVNIWNFNRTI